MKLYYNSLSLTVANVAAPSWAEAGNVKDLTLNQSRGEADVTVRANGGYRAFEPTLAEGEITFEMNYDDQDEFYTLLYNSWNNSSLIHLASAYDAISDSGTKYFEFIMKVTQFEESQPLEGAVSVSVTLKVAPNNLGPGNTTLKPSLKTSAGFTTTTAG